MMAAKLGTLIKKARTDAGLTQEALAKKIKRISADDISLVERGEKILTQAVLKEIAKVTGVTQKSLIDAAKAESSKSGGSSSKKSSSAKKSSSSQKSSSSSKKSTSSSKKSSASSHKSGSVSSSFKVSAEEKKIISAYRDADEKIQSAVKMLLLGTKALSSDSDTEDSGLSINPANMTDMLGSLAGLAKQFLG